MSDIEKAIELLENSDASIVLVKGESIIQKKGRGISCLMQMIQEHTDLSGYSCADKVVGKAAAMLMDYASISDIYAEVISETAIDYLNEEKIRYAYGTAVKTIMNDAKTDMCPMEKTVVDIHDPALALKELNITMMRLRGQSKE